MDKKVCNKHIVRMIKAQTTREIYVTDGKPSAMGSVTHMTKVSIDISSHRELATFEVANLQNNEVILVMGWLRKDNPTMDWNDKMITLNSERCTTLCLKGSPVIHAIPEDNPLEENFLTRFSKLQAKEGQSANAQSVRVEKLSATARVSTKGSTKVAGHDWYGNKGTEVHPPREVIVSPGIAIGLSYHTYGRIVPRSSLAVKYRLFRNAGVNEADYGGELKVVLVNLGDQPYFTWQRGTESPN